MVFEQGYYLIYVLRELRPCTKPYSGKTHMWLHATGGPCHTWAYLVWHGCHTSHASSTSTSTTTPTCQTRAGRPKITAPKRKNITPAEKDALRSLVDNDTIIIKPADKGGAIVVQNKDDYIKEGLRQLSDEKFYIKLDHDMTESHNSKVIEQLEAMRVRGEISEKVRDYLTVHKPRTSQLYLLPKIHKNVLPVPGRPIVKANDGPTERISAFVDYFLSLIVRTSNTYIQDTSDFLRKLGDLKDIPSKASLVTLDVCSLYTNIPNLEGLNAAYDALGSSRDESAKPSNLSLMELLNLVLTLNNFQFKGEDYLQVGGTAMGTRVAPSYANIFMSQFEEKHVYTYRLKPLAWYRYIDDVFCIWQHGDIELNNFVEHLNNTHDTIKFSMETSKVEISFLDTMVKLDNGEIITDLYCKPTDRNNYLPFNSAHPYHCKKGLPYGQFLRLRRICSRDEDFLTQSAKKAALLLQKQYPMELLINSYLKAQAKDRVDLLQPKGNQGSEKKESAIFLTTTYNPAYNGLPNQVRKTWDLLDRSSSTRDLHSLTLKVGLRRPKNLRDILVKSKLQIPEDKTGPKNKSPDLSCIAHSC